MIELHPLAYFVAFVLFAFVAIARPKDSRWIHAMFLSAYWLFLVGALIKGLFVITSLTSDRYDEYFLVTDRWLGTPSFFFGRLLHSCAWLRAAATFDYCEFLLIAFFAIAVNFVMKGTRSGYFTLAIFLTNPVLCGIGYVLMPACGPSFAFKGYPFVAPTAAPHVLSLPGTLPNCFPSGHLSAALLVMIFLWAWRPLRAIGILHVVLTALSTLGLGEHYAIDLIAAVPYTWGIVYAFGHVRIRAIAMRPTLQPAQETI